MWRIDIIAEMTFRWVRTGWSKANRILPEIRLLSPVSTDRSPTRLNLAAHQNRVLWLASQFLTEYAISVLG